MQLKKLDNPHTKFIDERGYQNLKIMTSRLLGCEICHFILINDEENAVAKTKHDRQAES